jgi:hypothetical protein
MNGDNAYQRLLDALSSHGCRVNDRGRQAEAQCPAHQDNAPSLSVKEIPGQALVFCHAGCSTADVVGALGLTMAELYDERSESYRYDDGRTVRRFYDGNKKRFSQTGTKGTPTLYHRSRLAEAEPGQYVFLVEGEKDVHAIESAGGIATTAPQGGTNFAKVDVEPLRDRLVQCVVDRDDTGRKWAAQVAAALTGVARAFRFVEAAEGKDAADHIAAGHGLNEFRPWADAEQMLPDPLEELPPGEEPSTRKIVLSPASEMTMKRIHWVWGEEGGGYLPLGGISLLAGREGIGKSTISYDVIAKVTLGTMPGEFFDTPKGVIIYATEDEWEPVILPRLVAAGADVKRVFKAEAVEEGESDWISFPRDLVRLREKCLEHDVALVVLDPIMSIIDGKLDTHKDAEVRKALDPLSRFASAARVAVLGLIHVNKSNGHDPLNSVMGSRAFSAVARSVLFCIRTPGQNGEPDSFLFSHEKCNLGPTQTSRQYSIDQVILEGEENGERFRVWTSRVAWGSEDSRRASDVMEELSRTDRPKGALRSDILAYLKERDDIVPLHEINAEFSDDYKLELIKVTLSRMVKNGEIERPTMAMYRFPRAQ